MRPVPVLSDYLVKLVIPDSRAILKPAVIYRFVSLIISRELSYVNRLHIVPVKSSCTHSELYSFVPLAPCPRQMRKCPVRALASASILCVLALSAAGAGVGAGTGHHVSTAGEMLRPCGSHAHMRHIAACASSSGGIQECAVGGRG